MDDVASGLRKVRGIVASQMGLTIDEVPPGLRLVEDLHVDSLEMQDLLLNLEVQFGGIPSAGRMAGVCTVHDLHMAVRDAVPTGAVF